MNLFFRLMLVIFQARRAPSLDVMDQSVVSFRVLPSDLDIFMHMNNGRYLTLMDLGRTDLMVRCGFLKEAKKRGWFPVVANATIDYKRSLQLFERYELRTRVTHWDGRWIYLDQQFVIGDRIAASATLKTMLRSKTGAVTPQEALAAIGYEGPMLQAA